MKNNSYYPFFELFVGILFISTSGPLGRYIELAPEISIFTRCFIGSIFLVILSKLNNYGLLFDFSKYGKKIIFTGILLAVHWVTYFYSLQYSSVAIGMLSVFTFPAITSFLEPLYFKYPFQKYQLILAIMVLIGLLFLVPEDLSNSDGKYLLGIAFGVFSAFAMSLRNIAVKSMIIDIGGRTIMTYQIIITFIVLSPFLAIRSLERIDEFWWALLALGIFTTAIGHTLFTRAFKHFSATSTSIMGGLQPVLGILMGIVFLAELPSAKTVFGGLIILSTVFIEGYMVMKKSPSLQKLK